MVLKIAFRTSKGITLTASLLWCIFALAQTARPDLNANQLQNEVLLQQNKAIQIDWINTNRTLVVSTIISNLYSDAHHRGYVDWQEEMLDALYKADNEKLLAVYQQHDYDSVVSILTGEPATSKLDSSSINIANVIGDADKDLVYTPLSPCRIIDTRLGGGGKLPKGGSRSFSINGNTSAQGGRPNCGVPDGVSEPPAAVLNVTVSKGDGNGYIIAWPAGTGRPNASIINFRTNQDIANTSVLTTSVIAGVNEISFFTSQSTHLIVDVMGYFSKPSASPLESSVEVQNLQVGAGEDTVLVTSCDEEYIATETGAYAYSQNGTLIRSNLILTDNYPVAGKNNMMTCRITNNSKENITAYCLTKCIKGLN